jgi:hypothetical protein
MVFKDGLICVASDDTRCGCSVVEARQPGSMAFLSLSDLIQHASSISLDGSTACVVYDGLWLFTVQHPESPAASGREFWGDAYSSLISSRSPLSFKVEHGRSGLLQPLNTHLLHLNVG